MDLDAAMVAVWWTSSPVPERAPLQLELQAKLVQLDLSSGLGSESQVVPPWAP
jgi:hypothetical protein